MTVGSDQASWFQEVQQPSGLLRLDYLLGQPLRFFLFRHLGQNQNIILLEIYFDFSDGYLLLLMLLIHVPRPRRRFHWSCVGERLTIANEATVNVRPQFFV